MDAVIRTADSIIPHVPAGHNDDERSRKRRINRLPAECFFQRHKDYKRSIESRQETARSLPNEATVATLEQRDPQHLSRQQGEAAASPRHLAPLPRTRAATTAAVSSTPQHNHPKRPIQHHRNPGEGIQSKRQDRKDYHQLDALDHRVGMVDTRAQGREDPCGAAPSWETANELAAFKESLNRERDGPASDSLPEGDWYQVPEDYDRPAPRLSPESPSGDDSGVSCPGSHRKKKAAVSHSDQQGSYPQAGKLGYECAEPHCNERFESSVSLKAHEDGFHRGRPNTFAASVSSRDSPSPPRYVRCMGADPLTNTICFATFSHPEDLSHHISVVHRAPERPFRCETCLEDLLFMRYEELVRHYQLVHPRNEVPPNRQIMASIENDDS